MALHKGSNARPSETDRFNESAVRHHQSRSESLIAIERWIFCGTFNFAKRVIFAYLLVFVQIASFAASAVACGGIDIRG
jgi:hypothetical protein